LENCSKHQYSRQAGAVRRTRWVSTLAGLGLMAGAAAAFAASETLYHFVDDRGISHFSNVPVDKRYRPYARVSVAPQAPPQVIDDGGHAVPYVDEHLPAEEAMPVEMSQEPLPVQIQEH